MKRILLPLLVVAVLGAGGPKGAICAEDKAAIADFVGTFVGRSISVVGAGLSERDFTVKITPYGKGGFTLEWTTVIRYTDGETKRKTHKVPFLPYRKRPGIFYSAVTKDVFGHMEPVDPLSGEPYVWAGLSGRTLTVNALYITDDGGYELQVYRRTLRLGGMDTHFERFRDGKRERLITGKLEKVQP